MNNPSYYIDGLLTQGNAALARTYLGITGGGGGIPEAPVDGQLYGRENANWVVVPPAGISDAPVDGTLYARLNAAWSAVPAAGIADAPSDGSLYARLNATWSVVPASVPSSRSISTTSPLTGGGDLSADRTLAIAQATSIANGYLTMGDWATFNGKLV